jgi:hypothetical protein
MKNPKWLEEDLLNLPNKLHTYEGFSYYGLRYNNEGFFKVVIITNYAWSHHLGSPYTYYNGTNYSPLYEIKDIKALEVLVDETPVSTFKRAAIGTLIFGGIGAVVGAISSIKAKPKSKLSVTIFLDSIELSAITLPCNKMADVSRLLSTFSNLEALLYPDKSVDTFSSEQTSKIGNLTSNQSISDEIVKLKKLLDDGVIEIDEYELLKRKLIT